jgi:hypothetical protein
LDEADVCAALIAALTGAGQFPQAVDGCTENRFPGETGFTAWDVVAACDALMTAARANGWVVVNAAPLSIGDWFMMATTPLSRNRRSPRLRGISQVEES